MNKATGENSPETRVGHCPRCGPDRQAATLALENKRETEYVGHDYTVTSVEDFRILRCLGCSEVYFQKVSVFSEDTEFAFDPKTGRSEEQYKENIEHWPIPQKIPIPDWVNGLEEYSLIELIHEIHEAQNSGHIVLAAIGTRTALDMAFVLKGASPGKRFPVKLKELRRHGVIGEDEERVLRRLTKVGNAAVHEAWKPNEGELHTLIDNMERFLHRVFIQERDVEAVEKTMLSRTQRTGKSTV